MAERVLRPAGKGFLFLDAHPAGCARTVEAMIGGQGPRGRALPPLPARASW